MKKSMMRLHGMKLHLVKLEREWMRVLKKLWIGLLRKRISGRFRLGEAKPNGLLNVANGTKNIRVEGGDINERV